MDGQDTTTTYNLPNESNLKPVATISWAKRGSDLSESMVQIQHPDFGEQESCLNECLSCVKMGDMKSVSLFTIT